jgi:hypothetical protein
VPIDIPNLDDLGWDELIAEGRSLIPSCAPGWTNHNPSDPGITLIELFAHLTEVLMFRVNQTTAGNRHAFLRLIRGPRAEHEQPDIRDEIRTVIAGLREIRRAVTPSDFEHLALSAKPTLPEGEQVARVKCIPSRNLEATGSAREANAPGHVSVVVLSNRATQPTVALLREVKRTLEPARLLTTRIHSVPAAFVTIFLRITLVLQANADPARLRSNAMKALEDFFHPLHGGSDGRGWPFGRWVFVSEVYQLLQKLDGIDYARKSRRPITDDEFDELTVGSEESARLVTSKGDVEAIRLYPDELVNLRLTPSDITIAAR